MVNPYRFYTYAYLREDRTPYYIGKGLGNRIYVKHQKGIRLPKDKSRIIFLKQNLTEEEAFKHEKYMISVFGREDLGTGILYNRTDGGEGHSNPSLETIEKRVKRLKGKKLSEEIKKKMSDAAKGRSNFWLKGIPRSKKTKQKISAATKGLLRNKKTKERISNALKGKPKSENTKEKFKKIMEEKYSHIYYEITTPNGNIEYVFNSLKQYSKENRLHSGSMYNVANKKANQHKGYKVKKHIKNEVL
jgi:hypothetical protein